MRICFKQWDEGYVIKTVNIFIKLVYWCAVISVRFEVDIDITAHAYFIPSPIKLFLFVIHCIRTIKRLSLNRVCLIYYNKNLGNTLKVSGI